MEVQEKKKKVSVLSPFNWDNFSPNKRGLSLFVQAGSRTYVFAQSFPVLFHCGSGVLSVSF